MSSRMKRILALSGTVVFGFVLLLSEPGIADHDTALLSWQASADPRVMGYEVWMGTRPSYQTPTKVGKATSYTYTKLAPGTYYFNVTSYDSAGKRSAMSNRVIKNVPACTGCK